MPPARTISAAGLLLTLGALTATSQGGATAQAQTSQTQPAPAQPAPAQPAPTQNTQIQTGSANPMELTTDTPEYCLHLLDRVSEMVRLANVPVPREVTDLTTEGHRMCAHGQTRGGIMRLRSALLIMEQADTTTYR